MYPISPLNYPFRPSDIAYIDSGHGDFSKVETMSLPIPHPDFPKKSHTIMVRLKPGDPTTLQEIEISDMWIKVKCKRDGTTWHAPLLRFGMIEHLECLHNNAPIPRKEPCLTPIEEHALSPTINCPTCYRGYTLQRNTGKWFSDRELEIKH